MQTRYYNNPNSKVFCLLFYKKVRCLLFYKKVGPWAELPADLEISIIKCNQSEIKYSTPCINGKY